MIDCGVPKNMALNKVEQKSLGKPTSDKDFLMLSAFHLTSDFLFK